MNHLTSFDLITKSFALNEDFEGKEEFVHFVRDFVKRQKYVEACQIASKMKMQNYFNIYEVF